MNWSDLVPNQYMLQLPANLGLVGTAPIADITKVITCTDVCGEVQKRAINEAAEVELDLVPTG
jgi:hypothetical protein